ncbi:MAG: class I tRNA ligase family protein, partial [Candidatus Zambryskibacteria bacterium]|nr:class I tRNA ligase family protein [Candidatus Zambryskibacteria bacterium]
KMKVNITANLEKYKFHQAGEELYQYFWHTFADKIIEDSKSRLSGDDSGDRRAAQETLMTILKECIKMLHPFTPFVTEEIWKMLPRAKGEQDLLIVEKW